MHSKHPVYCYDTSQLYDGFHTPNFWDEDFGNLNLEIYKLPKVWDHNQLLDGVHLNSTTIYILHGYMYVIVSIGIISAVDSPLRSGVHLHQKCIRGTACIVKVNEY